MYDFDKLTDRSNTNSYKWDINKNELPMFVADMDFETCPEVINALEKRLDNHIFGYNTIPTCWNDAYINWWKSRHNFVMERDWLLFSVGVVASISSLVRFLTKPGDKVLVQTPVYNHFFTSIENNKRIRLENPLIYKDGTYSIDWNDLEEKLSRIDTTMMVLCNPHNPIGKIWDKETLSRIGALCAKYNVVVISDEIHCDITRPGTNYVPFLSVNEVNKNIGVALVSISKTFNMAGLQSSAIICPNEELRKKVYRAINNDEIAEPNSFAIQAAVAALNNGGTWVDELNKYIFDNRKIVEEYLAKELPMLSLIPGDATYLLWVDISKVSNDSSKFCDFLRKETGLFINAGSVYGLPGKNFIRINIATQRSRVLDGLNRLKTGVLSYKK